MAGGGALTLTGNKAYIGGTSINNGGTLNISGGSSNIAIYVGTGGAAATMNVSGATTAVTLDPVGIGQTTAGTLNLFGGTIVQRMSSVFVGNSAAGVFNQSGGSVSISMPIYLGYSPGGNGVLNQTGGTSSYGTNNMFIGYGGPGSLTVNGSMALMNIAGNVSVGTETGSGTLTLASGTISQTAGRLYLGYGTTGVFNQTGGLYSFTGSGTFYLGCASAGTLDLSGGTLIVPAITPPRRWHIQLQRWHVAGRHEHHIIHGGTGGGQHAGGRGDRQHQRLHRHHRPTPASRHGRWCRRRPDLAGSGILHSQRIEHLHRPDHRQQRHAGGRDNLGGQRQRRVR